MKFKIPISISIQGRFSEDMLPLHSMKNPITITNTINQVIFQAILKHQRAKTLTVYKYERLDDLIHSNLKFHQAKCFLHPKMVK